MLSWLNLIFKGSNNEGQFNSIVADIQSLADLFSIINLLEAVSYLLVK